jgi:hypothetical protein
MRSSTGMSLHCISGTGIDSGLGGAATGVVPPVEKEALGGDTRTLGKSDLMFANGVSSLAGPQRGASSEPRRPCRFPAVRPVAEPPAPHGRDPDAAPWTLTPSESPSAPARLQMLHDQNPHG